ncbi:hypothetical protein J6590_008224 [Homalodisca vitripennis]|nr:hypothetical protein J6590_008224 [Homalodisca vitripennis]
MTAKRFCPCKQPACPANIMYESWKHSGGDISKFMRYNKKPEAQMAALRPVHNILRHCPMWKLTVDLWMVK